MTGKNSQPLKSLKLLDVIFKIAERCNINCTYCYYFNMGEDTALTRPATVSVGTTEVLARSIAKACTDMGIPFVRLHFHGGEPMMINPDTFDAVCKTLYEHIAPVARLTLLIQTNGILLSEKWLHLFNKYRITVGFSIDGHREAHDRYRLSKKGRSTFDLTEKNLKLMIERAELGACSRPSTISVIDPLNDYGEVYSYLRSLGVQRMTFLLPDRNADEIKALGPDVSLQCGRSLYEIFEAWFLEDNPAISVRPIEKTLHLFRVDGRYDEDLHGSCSESRRPKKDAQIIIARSDGSVAVNDSYIPALSWYKKAPVYSLKERALRDFLEHDIFDEIDEIENTLPSVCTDCKWRKVCRGGDLENRYSESAGFDNPSFYCEGYKFYFEKVSDLLVTNGYPAEMVPAI